MKIVKLHVQSFGKLQDFNLAFKSGLNVMQQNNGFGKTTLAAFVRAMLYGFTYSRSKRNPGGVSDSALWTNWNHNGKTGGTLVVEHNGENYRIERYFAQTAKGETLAVFSEKSGKQVNLPCEPGEYFLGLTADSFDRSVYFPQETVEISSNENFDTRLAGLVQNAENYDSVQDSLRKYRKNLRYEKGAGGKIWEAEEQRAKLQRELYNCQNAQCRQRQIDDRLNAIANERQKLEAEAQKCNEQIAEAQKLAAKQQLSAEQTENKRKLELLKEKLNKLEGLQQDKEQCDLLAQEIEKTPDAAKPQRQKCLPLLVVGLSLIAVGAVLCACLSNVIAVGLCVAAVGIVCTVLSFFVKPKLVTLQAGERDALVSQYFSIAGKYLYCAQMSYNQVQKEMWQLYNAYTGDKREYEALLQTVGNAPQSDGRAQAQLQRAQTRLADVQRCQQGLSMEEGGLAQERKNLRIDSVSVREKLLEINDTIAELKHNYEVAETVSKLLEQAKENLSTSYLPKLCERCKQLLCSVTVENYELTIDRAFAVQLRQNGVTKPMDNFSRGIREITLLCFRVALSELLFDGAVPLLVIDDAFVNFDEQNFLRATSLLKQLSQNTQVVYFTCHDRLGNLV